METIDIRLRPRIERERKITFFFVYVTMEIHET